MLRFVLSAILAGVFFFGLGVWFVVGFVWIFGVGRLLLCLFDFGLVFFCYWFSFGAWVGFVFEVFCFTCFQVSFCVMVELAVRFVVFAGGVCVWGFRCCGLVSVLVSGSCFVDRL